MAKCNQLTPLAFNGLIQETESSWFTVGDSCELFGSHMIQGSTLVMVSVTGIYVATLALHYPLSVTCKCWHKQTANLLHKVVIMISYNCECFLCCWNKGICMNRTTAALLCGRLNKFSSFSVHTKIGNFIIIVSWYLFTFCQPRK